jgi:hypothetical protein
MRLLRDEQPVKRREPFPLRIGTKGRNLIHVFKQSRETDGLKKYMRDASKENLAEKADASKLKNLVENLPRGGRSSMRLLAVYPQEAVHCLVEKPLKVHGVGESCPAA